MDAAFIFLSFLSKFVPHAEAHLWAWRTAAPTSSRQGGNFGGSECESRFHVQTWPQYRAARRQVPLVLACLTVRDFLLALLAPARPRHQTQPHRRAPPDVTLSPAAAVRP